MKPGDEYQLNFKIFLITFLMIGTCVFFITCGIYIWTWCWLGISEFHLMKIVPIGILFITKPKSRLLTFFALIGDICLIHFKVLKFVQLPTWFQDHGFDLGLVSFCMFQLLTWIRMTRIPTRSLSPQSICDELRSSIRLYLILISCVATAYFNPDTIAVKLGTFCYTTILLHATHTSLKTKQVRLGLGMVLFCISDFCLAYNRFVETVQNECWFVIVTYWFAMYFLTK